MAVLCWMHRRLTEMVGIKPGRLHKNLFLKIEAQPRRYRMPGIICKTFSPFGVALSKEISFETIDVESPRNISMSHSNQEDNCHEIFHTKLQTSESNTFF